MYKKQRFDIFPTLFRCSAATGFNFEKNLLKTFFVLQVVHRLCSFKIALNQFFFFIFSTYFWPLLGYSAQYRRKKKTNF